MNISLNRDDVNVLRWAVQVATDAVMIQAEAGTYPKGSAQTITEQLINMEERLVKAITEAGEVPRPNTDPTLF